MRADSPPKPPHDVIQIVFAAECGYLPHAAAMLHSLLAANPGERFAFHLLQGPDLALDESHKLEHWLAAQGVALNRVELDPARLQHFRSSQFFHHSIWYRILLPELLPHLSKVLYLDADLLITDRLRPLWETGIDEHLFAAVINPLYPGMPNWPEQILGVPIRRYLNSGVLLLNLDRMRHQGCVTALLDYSRNCPEGYGGTEQDALAALYHQHCLYLHPRWNVQTTFYDLRLKDLPVDRHAVRAARRNPAIVHFSGPPKPSDYRCRHPWREAYLRHRQQTPWPLAHAEGRTLARGLLRRLPLRWALRLLAVKKALGRRRSVTP